MNVKDFKMFSQFLKKGSGSGATSMSIKLVAFVCSVTVIQFILSIYHASYFRMPTSKLVPLKLDFLHDHQRSLVMNPDEELNLQIATNAVNGKGYSLFNEESKSFEPSSFHSPQTAFLYRLFLETGLDFDIFIVLYLLMAFMFHLVAMRYLYNLLAPEGVRWATLTVFIWTIYPSSFFYVGSLYLYEFLVTSLLIIFVAHLNRAQRNGELTRKNLGILLTLPIVMSFFRYHSVPILFCVLFTLFLFNGKLQKKSILSLIFAITLLLCLSYTPAMYKNYRDFGSPVISTQLGDVIWQGANPIAKGSWDGSGIVTKLGLSDMLVASEADQLQISNHLRSRAVDWIMENPGAYLILSVKKIVILFLPQNNDGGLRGYSLYNPLNFMVHLLFFLYFTLWLRNIKQSEWLILAPIVGSIVITVSTYANYRVRYFAEPFMIIFAVLSIKIFYDKLSIVAFRGKGSNL
jgi:hypothetical protein